MIELTISICYRGGIMKFNKIFSFILCFTMLCSLAIAEGTEPAALGDTESTITSSEILSWVEKVIGSAELMNGEASSPQKDDLGFAVSRESCTLYYDSSDIANAHLCGIKLVEPLFEGPRGEMMYDGQNELLKLYPNDNSDLVGDRDFAVLYLSTEMPNKASYGLVSRDGQHIKNIQYYVHERKPNGMYSNLLLNFEIENNSIESIGVYGLIDEITEQDVYDSIKNISAKQNEKSYFAYKTSSNGDELEQFEREDLIFSGIDVLSVTPERLIELFGTADTDEIKEDKNIKIRTMSWDGLNASFIVDGDNHRISRLAISDNVLEGPRGTVIGDTFSSVYSRFKSMGNPVNENNQEQLYGNSDDKSYGVANYYPNGMELVYHTTIELDKNHNVKAQVLFNFSGDKLDEITIVLQED